MSDAYLEVPKFKPAIPDELMAQWHTLTPVEQCLLKQQSIQEQQNHWMMKRLIAGDRRFSSIDEDLVALKRLKEILTAKWSVVAFLVTAVMGPIILLLLGAWLSQKFK